jgi:hypothetical protein
MGVHEPTGATKHAGARIAVKAEERLKHIQLASTARVPARGELLRDQDH